MSNKIIMHQGAPNISPTNSSMTNFLSFIFFSLAWFCQSLQGVTGTDVYNFLFRCLSVISVSFVIIANWKKVKAAVLRSYKNQTLWKKKKKGN